MSKRAFPAVAQSFAADAINSFSFLENEYGMAGPDLQSAVLPAVSYVLSGRRYSVFLETDEQKVRTRFEMTLEASRLVADLDDLVQAAGLGSRNQVKQSAQSLNQLRDALQAQAGFVRQLCPILCSPDAENLMLQAHATEWRQY